MGIQSWDRRGLLGSIGVCGQDGLATSLNRIMYRRQRGIMAGALMVRATTLAGAVPTR
jgi:hypothetical protein